VVALEVIVRVTDISEAKASLSKLVKKVLQGEEVIIGKAGKPVARLVPYEYDPRPRDLSQDIWKGQVWMADDFGDLPEEMLRAFQRKPAH
jgi:prevent-host-death family protein